jgi:hypothetical protein
MADLADLVVERLSHDLNPDLGNTSAFRLTAINVRGAAMLRMLLERDNELTTSHDGRMSIVVLEQQLEDVVRRAELTGLTVQRLEPQVSSCPGAVPSVRSLVPPAIPGGFSRDETTETARPGHVGTGGSGVNILRIATGNSDVEIREDELDSITDADLAYLRLSREKLRRLFAEGVELMRGRKPDDRVRPVAMEVHGDWFVHIIRYSPLIP